MGNQKQKWTQEEEDALLAGVARHGPGKWKNILKDPDFAPFLTHRSNIDLKDKWRNLSVSTSGQGSREKSRTFQLKTVANSSPPTTPISAPATSLTHNASSDTVMDDPANSAMEGKNAPRYNAMVFEAIASIKDKNGSDISAIVNFIEQRHEVPQNFRKLLSSRLRRLVAQGKLEKVQKCYKIKKDTVLGAKTTYPKQEDVRPRQPQNLGLTSGDTVEELAINAAYKVAEAENKSFLAADAVKEAERVAKIAEDTESMLQLAKEIYEACSYRGIVLLA
ncbi:Myb_DNA-binding domain-containing protein/Linker_histone domain-containing protein [Cephalotus follicularis]|uniref:MYB transcription factor n=1 Tax=Cephalotus follicularis TaxID=3775 RepID=A0A1Q3CXY0_CEPFO|nr:Myb_DNA-binding domain-containing protein/Linker_histone domain-containing protein [Cephalotus follicularis]